MKKTLSVLLVLCLLLGCLTACGTEPAATETEQTAASASEQAVAAEAPESPESPESPEAAEAAESAEEAAQAADSAEEPPVEEPEADAAAQTIDGGLYKSEYLHGASAVYVSGETLVFNDSYFYGAGYADDDTINWQIPNQYGYASVVVAAGQGTDVTMNNPTIVSDQRSYANGVFAAGMAKITVNGGSITTNNTSGNGHGIDVTYMGHVYAYDTVIHTSGGTSGGLASDFGGGFVQGERLDVTTEGGSSPAIFCAGTSIIMLKDSKLTANGGTGVILAHDHSVVALENCEVNAAGVGISGLQALPSPEASEGCTFFDFGSKITGKSGAVLGQSGGRTVMNLVGTECISEADQAINVSKGILTVNLWDTELTGSIECAEGCTLEVNVYAGAVLTGEVTGDVVINVYNGGEYNGSYAANEIAEEGMAAPEPATFDDYLQEYWGTGSMNWTESTAGTFVETYEPEIIANSAVSFADNSSAAIAYDPDSYDPSENGVALGSLNVGGAHGFTEEEVFGGAESRTANAGDVLEQKNAE